VFGVGAALGAVAMGGGIAGCVPSGEAVARLLLAVQAGEVVHDLAFSPDGKSLATVGKRQLMRVLDAETGTEKLAVAVSRDTWRVAFSPAGGLIAIAGGGPTRVFDADTGEDAVKLEKPGEQWALDIEFGPDGSLLAVAEAGAFPGTIDGAVADARIWEVETGRWVRDQVGHRRDELQDVTGVAFSGDGSTLATASYDGTVILWDVASGEQGRTLVAGSPVNCMAMRPDGGMVAAGTLDREIVLLDTGMGAEVRVLEEDLGFPTSAAFSPDGGMLAIGYWGAALRLWDVTSGEQIGNLDGDHRGGVTAAYSPDGTLVASGDRAGMLRVWELVDAGG
jgi:WD40 repeat protein